MNKFSRPTTDFNRVRDGRNSPDAYFDIDLNVAGEQITNIAGNSFYIDANPADGNAVVYFQETDNLRGPTPFYVSPGFIARIPFTQIRVVWASQPGKKIRIVYGVDTDFQPGSVSQVSFAGVVISRPEPITGNYVSTTLQTANVAVNIFTAASNPTGAYIYQAQASSGAGATPQASFIAKATAPASVIDGDVILAASLILPGTVGAELKIAQYVAPNLGLWYIVNQNETAAFRTVRWSSV